MQLGFDWPTKLDRRSKKALKLAIQALTDKRRKYAACPHAAEQGFEFGRQGLVHYNACNDAIQLFTEWLGEDKTKKAEEK